MKNLNLNQNFLFSEKIRDKNAPSQSEFESFANIFIENHLKSLKSDLPEFYNVIEDQKTQKQIMDFAKKEKGKWSKIIVCGIGGSALGPRAIRDALNIKLKIDILDSIDPDTLDAIAKNDLSKTLFVFISKSGGTLETVSQFYFFTDILNKKGLDWRKQSVLITGSTGLFRKIANEEKIPTFDIPEKLGGRFSVFSPVGLLPLALAGIDIKKIIEGAKTAKESSLSNNLNNNIALRLATSEFLFKKSISVSFIFAKKLMTIGNFWRQLLAESIGKNEQVGILPHVAMGTRDQHSDLQLFCDGPKDKLFTFISEKSQSKLKTPNISNKEFEYISKKTFSELQEACLEGTIKSLAEKSIPVQILTINKISEESIGEILFTFEAEIFLLAKMFNINPFNQPGVERGKQITKQILSA